MAPALLLMLLTQQPAPQPLQVVEGGLALSNVDQAEAEAWVELLLGDFQKYGLKVTSRRDVREALGVERQRQLLGCGEASDGSCIAEIAGALSADVILLTSVSQTQGRWVFIARLVEGSGAAVASTQLVKDTGLGIVDALPEVSKTLVDALRVWRPARFAAASSSKVWLFAAIPAGLGLVAGVVGQVAARNVEQGLLQGRFSLTTPQGVQNAVAVGRGWETASWIGFGLALSGVVTTLILLALGP